MSNPGRTPPRHVQDAAKVVDQWLKSVEPTGPKSEAEIAKMTPAERLDYARQWDQSTMPAWRDPRASN
jgi:hypothetical protein